MPKIIFKSRYLQSGDAGNSGGGTHAKSYIKYIATRDGVEKIEDAWKTMPDTKGQQDFIRQLVRDFPLSKNSFEYQDYLQKPTRATASEFISATLDSHADEVQKRENYVGYIAKRPRVEKRGEHGLFSDSDAPIPLNRVAKEVAAHDGNVWTNIISLRREDAARLGYDNAESWQTLLRSHAETFARQMKIPLEDLRWYAAFHNESHHPHCHMVAYSVGKEPYLSKKGIDNIRSELARDIFKQDSVQIYREQTKNRNALTAESRNAMAEIVRQINSRSYNNPVVEELLVRLADRMAHHKGKKIYGYLDQPGRNLVNAVIDELAKDKRIAALYGLWYEQREALLSTYRDKMPDRIPLSQNKEFKSVKNAVVGEALNILLDRQTFEDAAMEEYHTIDELPEPDIVDEDGSEQTAADYESRPPSERSAKPSKKGKPDWETIQAYRQAKLHLVKDSELYDPQEAVRLFLSCSGYEWAQYRLGRLFIKGDEIQQDIDYGLKWLWKAEAQDNHMAQYVLGNLHLKGLYLAQDFDEAEILFEQSIEDENSYAMYSLAQMHLKGLAQDSSTEKAVELLSRASEQDFEWAQYLLGKFYMRGENVSKDTQKAEKLLLGAVRSRSKEPPNQYAAYLLGKLYLSEDGVSKDAQKAVRYLSLSAEQGNQYAQYQLGKMLLYGRDIEQDIALGLSLLSASAAQGNPYAQRVIDSYNSFKGKTKSSAALSTMRLLGYLSRLIKNRLDDENRRDGSVGLIDKKLRREIELKREAHGQRMG